MTEMALRSRIRTICFRAFTLLVAVAAAVVAVAMMSVPAWAASKVLVTDVSPDGGATSLAADGNVTAAFSKAMKASTVKGTTFYLNKQGSSTAIPATVSYSGSSKTATLNPESNLEAGATYTATVKGGKRGVLASDGGKLGGTKDGTATFADGKVTWSFAVANDSPPPPPPPPPDTERPFLVSEDPTPGSSNVPLEVTPKATVNESLQTDSVNAQNITMLDESDPSQPVDVSVSVSYDDSTKTISVDPVADLEENTRYQVKISGIEDLAGNVMAGYFAWAFTTVAVDAPLVSSVAPTDGAKGVTTDTNVAATFSVTMDQSSITDQTFTLTEQGSSTPVEATVSYDSTTKKATLNPNSNLSIDKTYTVTIKGGISGVKDLSGKTYKRDYSWTFTSKTAVTVTPSPLDFTPGTSACNTTITKTVTITNNTARQVDVYPSVTNARYSAVNGPLSIAPGASRNLAVDWTAPSSGFRISDPGRLDLKDANGNIMGAGDLKAFINCGIEG